MKILKFFLFLCFFTMLYSCSQKEDLQLAEEQSYSSTMDVEKDKDLALLKDGANGTDGKGGDGEKDNPLLLYCDCEMYQDSIDKYAPLCKEFEDVYPFCDILESFELAYETCLELPPQCPDGFTFDGKNCYSGIHIPQGFRGFIWKNGGFYVKPNCDGVGEDGKPVLVKVDENCCPPGFGFDGKNCHYWGVYIPKEYDGGFIYNNAFYARPACK